MNLDLKMKGCPCVRGLDKFKKTGCPGKQWDGKEGCAAWHEDLITVDVDKNPEMRSFCIDVWAYFFRWWHNNRLAGNQEAMETFRNGMLTTDSQGRTIRKPDPAMLKIISMMETVQEAAQLSSKLTLPRGVLIEN